MSSTSLTRVLAAIKEPDERKSAMREQSKKAAFKAAKAVLTAKRLHFGSNDATCSHTYTMNGDDEVGTFKMTIRARSSNVHVQAQWAKKVPEATRGAVAVMCMSANHCLCEGAYEIDGGDGEFNFRIDMPLGLLAKSPGAMIGHLVDRAHHCMSLATPVVEDVANKGGKPIEAGETLGEILKLLLDRTS